MSVTYSLGVSNTTPSLSELAPTQLGLASNYGKKQDDAGVTVISNRTAATDQQEVITVKSRSISKVGAKAVKVYNPAKVQDAVLYSVDLQNVLRATDSDTGSVVDDPLEIWITVKHSVNPIWTTPDANGVSFVGQELRRCLGAFFTNTGSERFADLARGITIPTSD
jgi:hypothetical protein